MANSLKQTLAVEGVEYGYYPVSAVEGTDRLPMALKVLVENVLRNVSDEKEALIQAQRIVSAGLTGETGEEIEFCPARVLFQDFTGVPVFVDFAAMREACASLGGDPAKINPQIPCDLVIDHSVIADSFGCEGARAENERIEHQRNGERYTFLKWAQQSFENVRIVPPGAGICHQLNIEQFAHVAMTDAWNSAVDADELSVYFDTLVGTDSHTPTANGLGVLGWGVGGIEAEAAALGQPITTLVPKVIGVKLTGSLAPEAAGMDVALKFAQALRAKGVVGCFVECFGEGVNQLTATQRACISNMTPEYGSTCTLFPVDEQTLDYLRLTGRSEEQISLVKAYAQAQGTWNDASCQRIYADVIEIDLSAIDRCLAGPSRPHDRISLSAMKQRFDEICRERSLDTTQTVDVDVLGVPYALTHGAIAIAAVTSCTTATDPAMMLAAGLTAKKAAALGLKPKPWVKTILAPGSHAAELLLQRAGLSEGLNALGFYTCGFGCMSCIGNSGPVLPGVHDRANDIEFASVLSGNRNFDGRISPDVSQNYLMAPAMVVAYSLAGTVDIDMTADALGVSVDGAPVYLADIMPTTQEIEALVAEFVTAELFEEGSKGLYEGSTEWQALVAEPSDLFPWDENSTYVRNAPYFEGMGKEPEAVEPVTNAYVLAKLGDFITTDHISPAGSIALNSPAARYLKERGVEEADFNTYGSRRGNHEVMMRGTFANVKLMNDLAEGKKGGWTRNWVTGEIESIFDASCSYFEKNAPGVVLAGLMYGSGSSRDWAAKGPLLLGVRAVVAKSFERIHRSNLIGMGIIPLQFEEGEDCATLGLDGSERISIESIDFSKGLPSPQHVTVTATKEDGSAVSFTALVRVDTPTEGVYIQHGGILQYVVRNLSAQ